MVDDSDPDTTLFINVCRDIGLNLGGVGMGVKRLLEGSSIFALPPILIYLDIHVPPYSLCAAQP